MKGSTTAETRPRLVTGQFMLVMLSNFAYFLAVGATLPAVPRFVEGPLGGGSFQVGLTVGAFALAAVLLRPFTGRIGDRRGRRILIMGGGGLAAASLVGYALVDSLWALLLLRLATGAGEAMFYVGTASVINDLAPDERRGEALSYFSLSLFAGIGLGPILGEIVLEAVSFDAAWLVAAAASALAALVGVIIVETRPDSGGDGQMGQLLHRAALIPGGVMAASIWGLAMFTTFVPLYSLVIGMSGSRFLFALHSGVVFLIRLFGATLPDRLGGQTAARGALACSVAGFIVMAWWQEPVGLIAGTIVWSVGHSLAFPALMTMAINAAPASERAGVVGTFTAFFDMSFGLGAVAAGWIVSLTGYAGGFLSASVAAGAGLLLLQSQRKKARGLATSTATL